MPEVAGLDKPGGTPNAVPFDLRRLGKVPVSSRLKDGRNLFKHVKCIVRIFQLGPPACTNQLDQFLGEPSDMAPLHNPGATEPRSTLDSAPHEVSRTAVGLCGEAHVEDDRIRVNRRGQRRRNLFASPAQFSEVPI